MRLYIETRIRADLDRIWIRTQDPKQHQRWDLRFTLIEYADWDGGGPQQFTYGVRLLRGLTVSGTGVSAGERHRPDGTRTSALRFASSHPLSLIAEGRGYWRYIPVDDGIRFLTGYDYVPRWGRTGRIVDRFVFRPLMDWGTRWSFDRLRLWCERDITPERLLCNGLTEASVRLAAVVLASLFTPALAVLAAAAAIAVPVLPATPSARRCLRRPPERVSPPTLLDHLETR